MAIMIQLCNSMFFSPDMLNLAFGSPHPFTGWQVPLLKSSDTIAILLLSLITMKQIEMCAISLISTGTVVQDQRLAENFKYSVLSFVMQEEHV